MQEQLVLGDDRITSLERTNDELRIHIDGTREAEQRQDNDFKSQARELGRLRVCLNCLLKHETNHYRLKYLR